MTLALIESPEAPAAIGPYSHAVGFGDLVFVSGQLPIDPATGALTGDDPAGELRQSLANARAVLATAGATLDDVIKTTVFVTDMGAFAEINAAYAEIFGGHAPARSVVEVSALPKGARVEIEMIARRGAA
ncbi:Rid family detoxifying hydrolase [Salipiger sp. P9]|uniref:RidA family protein n=1 Tax=Salipiger pentaromativorans TaxID=2943193 RepID=UPI00215819A9|nr:Rid family detoxifying hydrolase [Salipiger pentaromativorans]MCR8549182.1 Rid family detoxifying hydrolase [Salipiger pentaromativorans]